MVENEHLRFENEIIRKYVHATMSIEKAVLPFNLKILDQEGKL